MRERIRKTGKESVTVGNGKRGDGGREELGQGREWKRK